MGWEVWRRRIMTYVNIKVTRERVTVENQAGLIIQSGLANHNEAKELDYPARNSLKLSCLLEPCLREPYNL